MNLTQEKSLFHLTGKLDLSQSAKDTFEQLAGEWPYFAPAQFFLSAKSNTTDGSSVSARQSQKTNLYFTNPNWLQFQLNDIAASPRIKLEKGVENKTETAVPQEEIINEAPKPVPTVEDFTDFMRKLNAPEPELLTEPEFDTTHTPHQPEQPEPELHTEPESEAEAVPDPETAVLPAEPEPAETAETLPDETEPEPIEEEQMMEETAPSPVIKMTTLPPVPEETEKENTLDDTDYAEDDVTEDIDPAAPSPVENKISGILSTQLAHFKKPLEADAALDIDNEKKRLHTIDYFASQGIKIDLSAIPQDKLTTHLRKFTDWLKQVKTSGVSSNEMISNLEMEKAVAETAKNSNETREIVTGAMADVLVKQGQTEKAIQLYIKLSFLNPEKSSYFAAKIEQLKGI